MSGERKRVGVLISGRGSNLAALIEAAGDADFPAEIVHAVSDREDAAGLALATARGVTTSVIARRDFPTPEAHDAAIGEELARRGVAIVALAGYMRVLGSAFLDRWPGGVVNIHPALSPTFPGLDTHRRALAAGVRIHGCTVHFVTSELDAGPIIAQAAVPVLADDNAEGLAARVLRAEHRLYPIALALVAAGKARMEGGRTVLTEDGSGKADGRSLLAPATWREATDIEGLARFTP